VGGLEYASVMADPSTEEPAAERSAGASAQPGDLAAEAERALTPRTPALALAGVWLVVAAVVAVVLLAVGLTLYFV
jgi:hypothetical protein